MTVAYQNKKLFQKERGKKVTFEEIRTICGIVAHPFKRKKYWVGWDDGFGKEVVFSYEKVLLGSISVLTSSRTTFLPILSVRASICFTMVSLKSSLILFLTVITALTLNFTGFSVDTEEEEEEEDEDDDDEGEEEEPFIKSSLIAATGNFAALFTLTTLLFSKGTKNRVWLRSDEGEEEGTNMDLSSNEEPKICFVRAILLFCSKKSSPSLSFVLCVCVCVFSL